MRFLLALLLLLPLQRASAASNALDAFTPAQRQEIVRVIRDALRSDPTILRDALAALQADDDRQQERVTSDAIARLGGRLVDSADPVEGNPNGAVTMVEFTDPRCPYCRRMLPTIADLLRAEPNLKLVIKDLPILGPVSVLESRALLAAQRQGTNGSGYVKLRDALMRQTAPSTPETIRATADNLGLDGDKLLRDMDDPAIAARLDRNVALARTLGIQGTPALIVGRRMIAGAVDLPELRQAVAAAK